MTCLEDVDRVKPYYLYGKNVKTLLWEYVAAENKESLETIRRQREKEFVSFLISDKFIQI
jgi:hypothetical protein